MSMTIHTTYSNHVLLSPLANEKAHMTSSDLIPNFRLQK